MYKHVFFTFTSRSFRHIVRRHQAARGGWNGEGVRPGSHGSWVCSARQASAMLCQSDPAWRGFAMSLAWRDFISIRWWKIQPSTLHILFSSSHQPREDLYAERRCWVISTAPGILSTCANNALELAGWKACYVRDMVRHSSSCVHFLHGEHSHLVGWEVKATGIATLPRSQKQP